MILINYFGTVLDLVKMYYLIFLLVIYFGWLVVKASIIRCFTFCESIVKPNCCLNIRL